MRGWTLVACAMLVGGLAACQPRAPACPNSLDSARFLNADEFAEALKATPAPFSTPAEVEIRGRKVATDKVVSGPLCNDDWRGTVYVTCDARVAEWSETPLFFKDCDLDIEEGTVVYVAAHYDAPYYKGCSCHTGEVESP